MKMDLIIGCVWLILWIQNIQLFWFFDYFLERKVKNIWVAYGSWSAIGWLFLLFVYYVFSANILWGCIWGIVVYGGFCKLWFQEKWKKIIPIFLAGYGIVMLATSIGIGFVSILKKENLLFVAARKEGQLYLVVSIFAVILMLFFHMLLVFLYKWRVTKIKLKLTNIIILAPIYQVVLIGLYFASSDLNNEIVVTLGLCIALISVTLDWYLVSTVNEMVNKMNVEEKLTVVYGQRKVELEYHETVLEATEKMRIMRHEFVNQLQTVYTMLESGQAREEARALLDASYFNLKNIHFVKYCDHPIINTVLVVKEDYARQRNIKMSIDATISKECMAERAEICSLLCEVFDYVIKLCENTNITKDDKENELIMINVFEENQAFVLTIGCDVPEQILEEMNKTAAIKRMQKRMDKYNGVLTIKADQNNFNMHMRIEESM